MELTGDIILIGETKTFGEKGFRKREVVIKTLDQYPQEILIEFIQDKCDLLNSYEVGLNVEIAININGRSWTNPQGEVKYFNSIVGWRIKKTGEGQQEGMPPVPPMEAFEPTDDLNDEDDSDLPF